MYAVVEYEGHTFEVLFVTDDVQYAIKLAFNKAKEKYNMYYPADDDTDDLSRFSYKITTNVIDDFIWPSNNVIISYQFIIINNQTNKINECTTIYTVIEIEKKEIEELEDVDITLLWNKDTDDDESVIST